MKSVPTTPTLSNSSAIVKTPSKYQLAFMRLLKHRLGVIGLFILLMVVLAAAFASVIAPYDPTEIMYEVVLSPPSAAHWFGTDEIGRDILSRILFGARVSLQIVGISIAVAVTIGSVIGMLAGYYGGRVDDVLMRIMDGLLAFPMIILALAIIAVLGPELRNAIIAISVVNIPGFARLVRSQVLSVRELEFVQAARAIGQHDIGIMLRHIWPAVSGNVIVYASLKASTALITESALAFLGLGAQPPTPTWGTMLSISTGYWDAWWMGVFPGAAIFLSVLAMNFLGDGLRDVFDSRMQST
ncbi:ABC transporter permease [soil metagenome]